MLTLALIVLASTSVVRADGLSSVIDDDYLYSDDRSYFDKLSDFSNDITSSQERLPKGNWAYVYMQRMRELGLIDAGDLDAYEQDGKLMTRAEMAMLVDKVLARYLDWTQTGRIDSLITGTNMPKPAEEFHKHPVPESMPSSYPSDDAPLTIPQIIDPDEVLRGIESSEAITASEEEVVEIIAPPTAATKDVVIENDDSDSPVTLRRSGPRGMAAQKISARPAPVIPGISPAPYAATKKDDKSKTAKKDAKKEKSQEETDPGDTPSEPVYLTQKDISSITDLVNGFKKELKDFSKNMDKEVREVKKIGITNQKEIAKLREDVDKFTFSGTNDFVYFASDVYISSVSQLGTSISVGQTKANKEEGVSYDSVFWVDDFALTMKSKPNPDENLVVSVTTKSRKTVGARSGYSSYMDNSNTAFNIHDLSVAYQTTLKKGDNRKFYMKSLTIGNSSVLFSPLTVMGYKIQGINASFALNKYTINIFGGRTAYHYAYAPGQVIVRETKNFTQYDRYLYGINVQSQVFGEASSLGNFQKIWMHDDSTTNFYKNGQTELDKGSCENGYWVKLDTINDPSLPYGNEKTSLFCMPAEKNSVSSAFVRYPLFNQKVWLTSEFAHSTYYRPAYKVFMDPDCTSSGTCSDKDVSTKYAIVKGWYPSKERNDQDDAFLVMFDFGKGPITVMPLLYARLGENFVTKYFGLPGFDMSSLGLDISALPVPIQSLEAMAAGITYDRKQDRNFKSATYFAKFSETSPMQLDPGLIPFIYNFINDDKNILISILTPLVPALNTRRDVISGNVITTTLDYFINEKMTFTVNGTLLKAELPKTCLDRDVIEIRDAHGNLIDKTYGNGLYECDSPTSGSADTFASVKARIGMQKYTLDWKTSKKAKSTTSFSVSDMNDSAVYISNTPATTLKLINDAFNPGRKFGFEQIFGLDLTKSTNIQMSYKRNYDMAPYTDDPELASTYAYDKPTNDYYMFMFKVSTKF